MVQEVMVAAQTLTSPLVGRRDLPPLRLPMEEAVEAGVVVAAEAAALRPSLLLRLRLVIVPKVRMTVSHSRSRTWSLMIYLVSLAFEDGLITPQMSW